MFQLTSRITLVEMVPVVTEHCVIKALEHYACTWSWQASLSQLGSPGCGPSRNPTETQRN